MTSNTSSLNELFGAREKEMAERDRKIQQVMVQSQRKLDGLTQKIYTRTQPLLQRYHVFKNELRERTVELESSYGLEVIGNFYNLDPDELVYDSKSEQFQCYYFHVPETPSYGLALPFGYVDDPDTWEAEVRRRAETSAVMAKKATEFFGTGYAYKARNVGRSDMDDFFYIEARGVNTRLTHFVNHKTAEVYGSNVKMEQILSGEHIAMGRLT